MMNNFLNYLISLPNWIADVVIVLIAFFIFFLGLKIDALFNFLRNKKIKKKLSEDHSVVQKNLKKLWDDEKKEWEEKVKKLEKEKSFQEKNLDNYRRQLSGFKSFTLISRKQKEFFYQLLVENETLEQLLEQQIEKVNKAEKSKAKENLLLVHRKKEFLTKLMDDNKIKNYISEKVKNFSFKKDKK